MMTKKTRVHPQTLDHVLNYRSQEVQEHDDEGMVNRDVTGDEKMQP